ncbi:UNVERIFIED_CONTAM: endoglucanase [Acetivibrio alkalicellulosi]
MTKKLFLLGSVIFTLLFTQVMVFGCEGCVYIVDSNFEDGIGLPWHVEVDYPGEADIEIKDSQFQVKVINPGVDPWGVMFRHRRIPIVSGGSYEVTFTVVADKPATIYTKIGEMGEPYHEYWNYNWRTHELKADVPYTLTDTFYSYVNNPVSEWMFFLGNGERNRVQPGTTFKFSNMRILAQGGGGPHPIPSTGPKRQIRVNQVGYLPNAVKKATLVSSSTTAHEWKLKNVSGETVASGETIVFGKDKDSGDNVHIIDFSDYSYVGEGYYLVSNLERSYPFDIGMVYDRMMYDALKYFYYNRSGSPIEEAYSHHSSFVRPAGHINQEGLAVSVHGFNGGFTQDISGGWYNDGSYGKDVNNAALATWIMQNQYERAKKEGIEQKFYGDGKLKIPESGNDIPDLLDEARWSMEFLLKMQVPKGYDREGMVFHKTANKPSILGVRPHELEEDQIELRQPSTAATLNFAAVSAQAARLWKDIDAKFADRCLKASEIAWNAAVANPDIFVPFDYNLAGFFGDSYMLDKFYWASCELLITTGKDKYLDYIRESSHFLEMPSELAGAQALGVVGAFDVYNTAALGTLSLALNTPTQLTAAEIYTAKANVARACDVWIEYQKDQGYGITIQQRPVLPSDPDFLGYPQKSNLYVLSQCIAFAYAYDYSSDIKYFNAMTEAVDYLMGRNPMNQCYVTHYGTISLENPHHQWFVHQISANYPKAPPGWISGGPTSLLEDNWVKAAGMSSGEIPPQKGFVDHIESWSTNSLDISLNASLAWVTSYLSEGTLPPPPPVSRLGDLNQDGSVNSIDSVLLRRYILEIPVDIDLESADLNGDGKIDSTDYILLRKFILEIIPSF